jgi:GT2 family glycosyltransferase
VPTELVVIDDSDSIDNAVSRMRTTRSCEIRYRWRRGKGLSSATNSAMRLARHDVCAFVQDDVEVADDWLLMLVGELVDAGPRAIIVGQVQAGAPEVEGGFAANSNAEANRIVFEGRLDHDVLFAQNMALYRSAFDEIGPFDERLGPGTDYPGAEDSDWGFRALRQGYSIIYQPAAVVTHRAWRAPEDFIKFRWGYGVARGGLYAKHALDGDRHMLSRLRSDLVRHLFSFHRLALHDRRRAVGNVALACGIVFGAARWTVTARKKPPE